LRVGMNFVARDTLVQIGERVTIDLRDAEKWKPRASAPSDVASREVVSERARVIATSTRSVSGAKARDESITKLLIGDCFAHATAARDDIAAMTWQLRNFIGLGAGLTPAGDDFVGGILFAAHHLRKVYALTWDSQPIDDLLDWARTQTNVISYTLLRDHAHGIGVEPLHDLIIALLSAQDTASWSSIIARVLAIGHTTGHALWDGVTAGIDLIKG